MLTVKDALHILLEWAADLLLSYFADFRLSYSKVNLPCLPSHSYEFSMTQKVSFQSKIYRI